MGCFHSSIDRINIQYAFTANDILYLKQSWNIIKIHNSHKFARNILIKTINQSPSLRQFWVSKIQVDGNNYDYSQSESCLKTDLSWHIGLCEYGIQIITLLDQLLPIIDHQNQFKIQIQSFALPEKIFPTDYQSLMVLKQCTLETVQEHLKMFDYVFTEAHEQAWNKFLSYIIEYMIEINGATRQSTESIMTSDIVSQQH